MTRSIARIVRAEETLEGAGFRVRRPFPTRAMDNFDPFLLLDEMGPMELAPGEAKGAPDHPHRGFETVSYVLDGRMQHADSAGHAGTIGPGDVQWMTAGRGVVHSEMPDRELALRGGRMHGFQLWVNLPQRDKMMAPRYQEIPAAQIPEGRSDDGKVRVRVIAGESLGARAVIETQTPIFYLHAKLEPGAVLAQPAARTWNTFAYVVSGTGRFGDDARGATQGDAVFFAPDGDELRIESPPGGALLEVLILGGVPLGEPIARYGPFVMNTRTELLQAVEDYQAGRMGEIRQGP